jgi:hypothetical protein
MGMMRRRGAIGAGLSVVAVTAAPAVLRGQGLPPLPARLLAVGVTGAGALSPVGAFLPGGPIRDRPNFAAYTQPGRVLDAQRVLVCSESQFGAPRAILDWPEGSVLSLESGAGDPLVVPAGFASSDGQAAALDGGVQLFCAQSPAFLNGRNNPQAVTAALPPVGHPLGISINNAFGRPWFPSAPLGSAGAGTESICDPDGLPLAGAPSVMGGGVFAGLETNRAPEQVVPGGMDSAGVANAFLGPSPDGGGRAVFAVATAAGAIVQAHSEKGVDGLAPDSTIGALEEIAPGLAATNRPVATHTGMLFNWVPDAIIYVADPMRHAVVALTLVDDGAVFRVGDVRRISSPMLSVPIDLAPAVPEVVSPVFSSNTTLAGGSDLYVANRGDGTVARLAQDGRVLAVRQVEVPGLGRLGAGRLNGIAVSPDAQRLWLSVSGAVPGYPDLEGAVVEAPAFGPG